MIRAILLLAAIAATSYGDEWRIPNANDALAGVQLGPKFERPAFMTRDGQTPGRVEFFPQPAGPIATPVNVMRATNIPEAVRASYLSVVRITASTGGGSASQGSGTYLGDGLVLTNRHVVSGGYSFTITLKDGTNYPAQLAKTSSNSADLALLETRNLDHRLKAVPISVEDVRAGQVIYPSGFDQGRLEWHTIWPARVNQFYADGDFDSAGVGSRGGAISGNSGGPTFNSAGELISPLHSTTANPSLGNGRTIAVCFRSTRWFLFPWRRRIMRSLEEQYGRYGRYGRQPIIIQIAPGENWQPQAAPQRSNSRPEILIEGNRIKIVPLKSTRNDPAETQYGYCPPSTGGIQYQQCPPNYGQPSYGQPNYGPSRPVLPDSETPRYQPETEPEPPAIELDYDALAEALLPKMAGDDRFKGADGKDGKNGTNGRDGQPGTVTQGQLTAMSAALLEQMARDPRFKGQQGRPGEITPEQIAELTEEIKRGLSRRVLVVDGVTKQVLDDETYAFDEPFVFDTRKLQRRSSTQ